MTISYLLCWKISRDIQKAAGAEGIARLAGFGDDFEDPNFRLPVLRHQKF